MNNQPKILKWALILSIIIVLNLFYNVTLSFVFDQPNYNDFCDFRPKPIAAETTQIEIDKIEEQNQKCQDDWSLARNKFEKNIFISLIVLGILTFIVSILIKSNSTISIALAFAAVLDFVIASMRYWENANEILKIIILLIALVILIYLAIKKFSDKK